LSASTVKETTIKHHNHHLNNGEESSDMRDPPKDRQLSVICVTGRGGRSIIFFQQNIFLSFASKKKRMEYLKILKIALGGIEILCVSL
jgi:hypothetical protein